MAVLIGIDEAGFGPLLGPLVVSSASFSLPAEETDSNLWTLLSRSVTQQKRRMAGRLLITDSKKAYTRSSGLGQLERTVLAVLSGLGHQPKNLHNLLETVCPHGCERLGDYPWYQCLQEVPIASVDPDKIIAAGALMRDLEKQQMALCDLTCICLDVAHYNKQIATVRNKSNVLFSTSCQLIQKALESSPAQALTIVVDRQGGRIHYRPHLQRMFPQFALTIVHEDDQHSHYRMESNHQNVTLHFRVKADRDYLPVALASMASKYLRELLMGCINQYFTGFCADLAPTAGYWQDGQRFLKDLEIKCPHVQVQRDTLVRCR
ncbi:hypothetical protein ACFL3F_02885 [Planctomycetota bacterium]